MQITPINDELLIKSQEARKTIAPYVKRVEEIAFFNQRKVLHAFKKNQVSDFHLSGSTGYGYDDSGRDVLEQVYSDIFGAEACLVRNQIISGTMPFPSAYSVYLVQGMNFFILQVNHTIP